MAPFDTNAFVTCWVPLQPVPAAYDGGTGLCFATASHRDFALPFWSDPRSGLMVMWCAGVGMGVGVGVVCVFSVRMCVCCAPPRLGGLDWL